MSVGKIERNGIQGTRQHLYTITPSPWILLITHQHKRQSHKSREHLVVAVAEAAIELFPLTQWQSGVCVCVPEAGIANQQYNNTI